MDRSVRFSYRYHDTDLLELSASAWTGSFGGTTRLYLSHGELTDTANALSGFHESRRSAKSDIRSIRPGVWPGSRISGADVY